MLYKLHLVLNKVHHLAIAITKNSEVEIEGRRITISLKSNGILSRNLSLVNYELEDIYIHIERYLYAVYNCSYFHMRLDYIFTL
nr:MAG TPA: hypothetical protein [Caudoviricetes sp.]